VVVQKHNNISYTQTGVLFVPSKLIKMGEYIFKSPGDKIVSAGVSQRNNWQGEILVTVKQGDLQHLIWW